MNRKRKSMAAKGKEKLTAPSTQKSPRLAGLPPSLPPSSPKFVLGPNKLLVLAVAASAFGVHSKAREDPQAPVVEQPKVVKGKSTARISVKPIQKRFSQRIIARGGPSRPKPKKIEVINLGSDDEGEKKMETAVEKEGPEPEVEEEDEAPEEAPASLSLLSLPTSPSKRNNGAYDDPHY
ncbi:hypothetical protein PIB30_044132 [Stylosanthes scabra]|uniref:Uncharacterized protein n=1 Tax=Stylosanthes scabra TaxID=79078 RepID=A0ABU6TG30_9FABA|nr:hypothetical protein [Stylosanthes scabra]